MLLKSVAGEYEPSFFIIRLHTTQSIDLAPAESIATFIHEYIHFLQDLILPYCMRGSLLHLFAFFDQIDRAHDRGEIRLPDTIPLEGSALVERQNSMTWGSHKFVSSVGGIQDLRVTEFPVPEHGFKLYQYDLVLDNGESYQFGARDMLEYIAYKIESKHFPSEERLPDLPYSSVDLMVTHLGAEHLSVFKRIALAEYCLLNDNPAHQLVLFLKDLQAGVMGDITSHSDEAFAQFLRNAHWKSHGVKFEKIQEKLDRRSNQLKQALQHRFPLVAFPDIHSWVERVVEYARDALAGRSIFAEFFAAETPNFFRAISKILEEVGIPLIVNDAGEMGTSLGGEEEKDQFLQLLLAYEFLDYLQRDDMQCPMCQVCERDRADLMDDDCLNAPFRRALRGDLCPFGAFVKSHGLTEVRWYVNDRLVPNQGTNWP